MRVVIVLAALCAVAVASRLSPIPADKCGADVITDDQDKIFVFALSEDSVVWYKFQKEEGGWSLWRPVADRKKMGSGARAVRFPNGTMVVFARGTDRKFYHTVMTNINEFSDWSLFGPEEDRDMTFHSPPVPVITPAGQVLVFGIHSGTHTVWYTESWPLSSGQLTFGKRANLGGQEATSSPSVLVDAEGLVNVFIRGTTRCIYHLREIYDYPGPKAWSEWEGLGGVMSSAPAIPVALNGVNNLEVFGRAADKALWQRGQVAQQAGDSAEWSPWVSHGGVLASGPAVAVNDDGLAEVFTRATDKAIYYRSQLVDEAGLVKYSNWRTLGGMFSTTPNVVVKSDGMLFLTARGVDKAIWYSYQSEVNGVRTFSSWKTMGGHTRKYPC